MPSPAAVAEFHIKTVTERRQGYQIHGKRKSSMELCCCFFHIQMSSLLWKMQPRHEWATSSFWPELLLSRSESGSWSWGCWVSDELHHSSQQAGAWIGWNYQLRASRSTNESALKLEDAALKLSDTNKLAKPGNQQCNNLHPTLTNKYQRYQDTGWDSLVGPLMMVVQLMFYVSANWPQFVHASSLKKGLAAGHWLTYCWHRTTARHPFYPPVVHSSTAFTSDLPLPFSANSITSWQNLDIGCTQVRNLS